MASASSLKASLIASSAGSFVDSGGVQLAPLSASTSIHIHQSRAPVGLLDRIVSLLHFIFPQSFSHLDVAALLVKNCIHHRTSKQYYSLDTKHRFRAFRLVNSQGFRKTAIVCALILAVLPSIEVPVSIAAPCWLSFVLELFCYAVLTVRVCLEHACYKTSWSKKPWFSLLNASLLLCWIDVIITMALVTSSGGDWLSFNNCGMPEPERAQRSGSWVYVIARFSRYLRPIIFMEWNIRTRYLFKSMVRIMYELLVILSILGVFIFLFAAFGYFIWSDPDAYISALPKHFAFFRSFIQSLITSATLTTAENYPSCMMDYMSVSFSNFFFFVVFALLSIFFALNVVLSTVYSTYQNNLRDYYQQRRLKDASGLARSFQLLCNADNLMSRQRFQTFMRVYDGLNHLDPSCSTNQHLLKLSQSRADLMFSMLTARLRIANADSHPDIQACCEQRISEVRLMQKLALVVDAPLSFLEFTQLVPLVRYYFYFQDGSASSFDKQHILHHQISFADIMKRIIAPDRLGNLPPLSLHSSSYFICTVDPRFSSKQRHSQLHPLLSNPDILRPSLLETFDASQDSTESASHEDRVADNGLVATADINTSSSGLRLPCDAACMALAQHKFWRILCNAMIIAQFGMIVLQLEIVFSEKHCRRSAAGAQEDAWNGCQSWSHSLSGTLIRVDTAFNVAQVVVSSVLLFGTILEIRLKGQRFFIISVGNIAWLNIIDSSFQATIFLYDILQLTVLSSTVTSQDFIAVCMLRLLRVCKLLAMVKIVTSTTTLIRNFLPILKPFFLIAYTFFFIFSIFGMSLFSYAASSNGIALYPTQNQYVEFYMKRDARDYPNSRNPGNFGCNSTDILGAQGVCGQAGPQSPLPYWSTTDTSDAAVAALNAAFIIGSGIDARVGGCFNLAGEANNRVLPCYCFYTAHKMNRTTSCDWLNAEWYRTDLGLVSPTAVHLLERV
jgi:hypothetical protein